MTSATTLQYDFAKSRSVLEELEQTHLPQRHIPFRAQHPRPFSYVFALEHIDRSIATLGQLWKTRDAILVQEVEQQRWFVLNSFQNASEGHVRRELVLNEPLLQGINSAA